MRWAPRKQCSDRILLYINSRQTWITFMPKNSDEVMACRVCGYIGEDAPWGEDGKTASFDICPCCGVEWGYEDILPEGVFDYRAKWINGGAQWREPRRKPKDW